MTPTGESSERPDYDPEIQRIADYVVDYRVDSEHALETARLCLMDTLACGILALGFEDCRRHLGPRIEGLRVPGGVRVPGTPFRLDPEKAAFDIGCANRWLDYNDTWLAAEWGHPSDNLGGILAVADYDDQRRHVRGLVPLTMATVLEAMVKAHEIQGVLSLDNSFNRVGLDHVVLVKVATTAVAAWLQGASREQIRAALSHAWVDGQPLRTYRHAPNTGPRKSWAAGDATARGVRLAELALRGEPGIPTALSQPQWGFCDVLFAHDVRDATIKPAAKRRLTFGRELGSYVMEHVLFKIAHPTEFHAQTAAEAAIELHAEVQGRIDAIERIELTTQEPALRIIAKEGPLANPADRDHCLQYVVAVALLFGDVVPEHYSDACHAENPAIDDLRSRMHVAEDERFSRDYLDPDKRAIPNAVQVFFTDGSATERVEIDYPLGHPRRRREALPLLEAKFRESLPTRFPAEHAQALYDLCTDRDRLRAMPVHDFMGAWML